METLNSTDFKLSPFSLNMGDIKKKFTGYILLWAEWCGHCKTFKPIFEQASQVLPSIQFGMLQDKDSVNLRKVIKIQGFPTILIYKNSKLLGEYDGPRSIEGLSEYKQWM